MLGCHAIVVDGKRGEAISAQPPCQRSTTSSTAGDHQDVDWQQKAARQQHFRLQRFSMPTTYQQP